MRKKFVRMTTGIPSSVRGLQSEFEDDPAPGAATDHVTLAALIGVISRAEIR